MGFLLEGLGGGVRLLWTLDPEVYAIAWVSLRVSLVAVACAAVPALPAGLLIGLGRFPGRRALIVACNTLMALPTVVVGLLVYGLLSRQGALGFLDLLYTPSAMVLAQAILAFPLVAALVIAAVASQDARVHLTALTLGASPWRARGVVLREARLAVMAAFCAAFGRVLTEVGAAIMVGGNIRHYTRTLTTAITLETAKGEFAQGMALGVILLALALAVNLLAGRLQGGRA